MRAKRFISVILSILIVCSSFAGLTAFADEANKNERTKDVAPVSAEVSDKYSVASSDEAVQDQSGTTGDCTWTYEASTKTLTISGNGEMGDYYWADECPWCDLSDSIIKIVIENGVTSIGESAFYGCTYLTSITIPNSVTSIGDWVFFQCFSLSSVTIGSGVTSIGEYVFDGCTSLSKIEVDENNQAYSSLNGDLYNKSQTELIQYAIGKKDNTFVIPNNVTSIGYGAFSGCTDLTGVIIPDSVTSIGDWAFSDCTSLTSVTIPDSVTSIGYSAFSGCTNLIDVTIGNGVTSVGRDAFYTTAIYNNQPVGVVYIDNWLIDYKGYMPENTEIVIKNGTRGIADNAFQYCTNLTSVTIPDSVTGIGYRAFIGCTSLTGVTIPDGVTSIVWGVFKDCKSLTSVTIPDSVTSIEWGAFRGCTSLTSITIPDSVTSIDGDAFHDCTNLTSVTIPDSVTSIGECAFYDCTRLTSVTIPDSVTSMGDWAFCGCTSLTSVTIGNSVTSIEWCAFRGCTSLTSVTIPDSVTSIEWCAFSGCTNLTSVTIPNSVTDIAFYAFGYDEDDDFNKIKVQNFTIYGYKGTSAEEYAEDNEFNFVSLDIGKSVQNITGFQPKYEVTFGDNPFSLNAKAETTLSYSSDNTSVAEVSANGTVTINGAGKATITITAKETANYKSATATVKITVAKATQKVTGVKAQYFTSAGKSFILNPKAKTKLTYTSSNKNVAVVSSNGKVTVKAGGCAYITVKASKNGNYKSAYVKTKIISAPRDFTSKDVSKVKKTGKTKAKITWKSLAGAKGYTVQLATNKSYKGAKTVKNSKNTANFTKLKKGKTYYVRISAYTKVSGKNYSNKWYTVKFKM